MANKLIHEYLIGIINLSILWALNLYTKFGCNSENNLRNKSLSYEI